MNTTSFILNIRKAIEDHAMLSSGDEVVVALSGGAVSAFIIVMAIYMIVTATKKLKALRTEVENGE